ncbi:hypothetical protein J4440_01540 [Candidatus Woesearchaeota archaeon]|nr:hypothetical protein [Candidatus Woesearchaeota archaeon]
MIVDFVSKFIKDISKESPVYFQRDNDLYIASEQAIGRLYHGLKQKGIENELKNDDSRIVNLISSHDGEFIINNEDRRKLRELIFLQPYEIPENTAKIREQINDEDIRLFFYAHEDKRRFGYTFNGTTAYLENAYKMNIEKYLEKIREKERNILKKLEEIAERKPESNLDQWGKNNFKQHQMEAYYKITLPGFHIITPNMEIQFPHGFEEKTKSVGTWGETPKNPRHEFSPRMFGYKKGNYSDSYYKLHIRTEDIFRFSFDKEQLLKNEAREWLAAYDKEFYKIISNFSDIQEILRILNKSYNMLNKSET